MFILCSLFSVFHRLPLSISLSGNGERLILTCICQYLRRSPSLSRTCCLSFCFRLVLYSLPLSPAFSNLVVEATWIYIYIWFLAWFYFTWCCETIFFTFAYFTFTIWHHNDLMIKYWFSFQCVLHFLSVRCSGFHSVTSLFQADTFDICVYFIGVVTLKPYSHFILRTDSLGLKLVWRGCTVLILRYISSWIDSWLYCCKFSSGLWHIKAPF